MATAGEDKVENRMVYHGRLQATATVHDVIATTGSRNGYKSVVRLFWCDHTGTKFFGRRKRARYAFDQDVVRGAIRSCGCRRSKSWREVLERPKLAGSLRFCDHQAEVEGEELSVDETADIEAGAARAADGENGTPVEKKPRHTPPNKKVGISIADPMAAIRETRKVLLERMAYLAKKKDQLFGEAAQAEADLGRTKADLKRVDLALGVQEDPPPMCGAGTGDNSACS